MEYPTLSEPQTTTLPVEGVGFLIRGIAKIIDLVIHNVVGVGFGLVVGIVIGLVAGASGGTVPDFASKDATQNLIAGLFGTAGFIFYSSICEAYYGATLGKMILGLFVVDKKGGQISFGAALVRSLLFFIDQMFVGLVGYMVMKDSPLKQRLGDKAAGTVVIKRSEVDSTVIPSGCMLFVVLIVGLVFDGVIQVIPVLIMAGSGM
jgi:uncharacterized RDD family membrane protein YckC